MKKLALVGSMVLLFAAAGYAYYAYVGCDGGSCAITSSPFVSTIFGAAIGLSLGLTLSDGRDENADL